MILLINTTRDPRKPPRRHFRFFSRRNWFIDVKFWRVSIFLAIGTAGDTWVEWHNAGVKMVDEAGGLAGVSALAMAKSLADTQQQLEATKKALS